MKSLRIVVTGKHGQVVTSLVERGAGAVEVIRAGRPELDLLAPKGVAHALEILRPDVIVNAGAYTMVDKAEQDAETAMRINADGAQAVAEAAQRLGVPLIHLSTDYVFDGVLERPYQEEDATGPTCVYGRSKLEGERRVAAFNNNHVILRTAWVYSPFGANFLLTMLRLGKTRTQVGVVDDQRGNPTYAIDIADGVLEVAQRMAKDPSDRLRGVFHMTGSGVASWADFAEEIFRQAERHGHAPVEVNRIATVDYPTPAKRPANSQLNSSKLAQIYGVRLPDWRSSAALCVDRLMTQS